MIFIDDDLSLFFFSFCTFINNSNRLSAKKSMFFSFHCSKLRLYTLFRFIIEEKR